MADESKPTPVEVVSPVPIPVEVIGPIPPVPEARLPSTTTMEQDRTTAGQRRVNILWEGVQAMIAVIVVGTGMFVSAKLALAGVIEAGEARTAATAAATASFVFMTGVVNLVIGFYFSRTNHTKVGGVGDTQGKER